MGKIFCIMGKSASGKDSIAKKLFADLDLKPIILYTTRPIRIGEINGENYYFISNQELKQLEFEEKVIEKCTYHTVHGDWTYATIGENIDIENNDYLTINTLEGYLRLVSYYSKDNVIPIYVSIDLNTRIERAFSREEKESNPKYKELCRRFIMDEIDFSEEKLRAAGITDANTYLNYDFDTCLKEIEEAISFEIGKQKRREMNR